jgi:hypothetical protein
MMDEARLKELKRQFAETAPYEPVDAIADEALSGVESLLAEVRRLEAENAALRARAVPVLEWHNDEAQAGLFECEINPLTEGDFDWSIVWPGKEEGTINLEEGTESTREEAESACEAALLRLVGCK